MDDQEYAPFHGNEAEFEQKYGSHVADYIYPHHKPDTFLYSLGHTYTYSKDPSSGESRKFLDFSRDDDYRDYMYYIKRRPQSKYNDIQKYLKSSFGYQ